MNKRIAAISLIALTIVGSILTFYGWNLLFSDVANMLMSKVTVDLLSSLPGFIISLDFILASIYTMRLIRRPQYKKRMSLLYLIILGCFSLLGIIACIVSGIIVYGSLFAPYPFKGYLVICLVFHAFALFFSIGAYYNVLKVMKPDEEKRKMSVHYVLYTIVLCLFVSFAYYRFGAVLLAPVYIQWRTIYLTWPFYTALFIPMALLVHTVLYSFGVYKNHPIGGIIHAGVCLLSSIGFSLAIIFIGRENTQFVSAISPVLPLERLASLPIDTIVFVALTIGLSIYECVYSYRYYIRKKKEN